MSSLCPSSLHLFYQRKEAEKKKKKKKSKSKEKKEKKYTCL